MMEGMGLSKNIDWIFTTLIWVLLILGTLALWWLSASGSRGSPKKKPAEGRPLEGRQESGTPEGGEQKRHDPGQ